MPLLLLLLGLLTQPVLAALVANAVFEAPNMTLSLMSQVCKGRNNCYVLVDVPAQCAGNSSDCPLLFCFHGYGGSADEWRGKDGYHQVSDMLHAAGWIGIYVEGDVPTAGGRPGWNNGDPTFFPSNKCNWDDFLCTEDPSDTAYVMNIISAMRSLGASGALYAYGTSMGAGMAQRMGANANATLLPFSGVASHSMQMFSSPVQSASYPIRSDYTTMNYNVPHPLSSKIGQLSIHGTADGTVPYNGGPCEHSKNFTWASEEDSNKAWAQHAGCDPTAKKVNTTAVSQGKTTTAVHHTFTGCPSTAPVEWYEVIGAGHCTTSNIGDLNITAVVLQFFQRIEKARHSAITF